MSLFRFQTLYCTGFPSFSATDYRFEKLIIVYEALSVPEEALNLLQKAVKLLEGNLGQYRTIAGTLFGDKLIL
jgi:hypothetical protein